MNRLRTFLTDQGLTFQPLLQEMTDHISCDLEYRMSQGYSFDEAWQQSINEIPGNHFQTIQKETMKTINKQFTLSQGLSYLALALLFASMFFKVQHFPLSGELLLASFGAIAAALLTSSLSGIYLNKEKKGAIGVLAVVAGVIILLTGYSFKILHLPGADNILYLAVTVIIASLVFNTLYVYQHASGQGNLLTFLHEKYTPGIERFLLLLLFPLIIYKVVAMVNKPDGYLGSLALIVVVFGAGLQFIALNWRIMEKNLTKRNRLTLTATVVSFLCLTLPFLGSYISFEIRVILVTLFTVVSAWLAYYMEEEPKRIVCLVMACLVPVLFLGWALIKLAVIPTSANRVFFNFPVLLILITGLLVCRKNGTMRTYLIISLSAYLFEYLY